MLAAVGSGQRRWGRKGGLGKGRGRPGSTQRGEGGPCTLLEPRSVRLALSFPERPTPAHVRVLGRPERPCPEGNRGSVHATGWSSSVLPYDSQGPSSSQCPSARAPRRASAPAFSWRRTSGLGAGGSDLVRVCPSAPRAGPRGLPFLEHPSPFLAFGCAGKEMLRLSALLPASRRLSLLSPHRHLPFSPSSIWWARPPQSPRAPLC